MIPPSTAYTSTFRVGVKCRNGFIRSKRPYITADAKIIFVIDPIIGTSLR